MGRKSTLTEEQKKAWQKLLSNALIKERYKLNLTGQEIAAIQWHDRYVKLMEEKLEIIT